jgi:hypothetical protein
LKNAKQRIFIFRLRNELNRSNEQLKEYRQIIYLINEKSLTTRKSRDDLNHSDSLDDHSKPIENKFLFK